MNELERLAEGIRRADAAGDADGVRVLGTRYRELQRSAAPEIGAATSGQPITERAHVALGGFLEGIPIAGPAIRGGLDRVGAGIRSVLPGGQPYEDELAFVQGRSQELAEQHPVLDVGGQVAGGIAGMAPMMAAAPAAFGLSQATKLGRMGASALSGGALGAADTAARGGDVATGAALGAAGGALAPAVGGAVGTFWQGLRGQKAPTIERLTKQAHSLYDRARDAGVQIADTSWSAAVADIARSSSDAGINRNLHPKAMGVLRDLIKTGGKDLGLDEAEQWRRVLKGVSKSTDPDERRIGKLMVEHFDRWQASLKPSDVLAGDPQEAVGHLTEARQLWQRVKKGELIGEMIENAELGKSKYTQSGVENALRAEFRSLSKNASKMRFFSPEERAAIKGVANGQPFRNAMRWLGKFAPHGTVSTAAGFGGGAAIGALTGLDPVVSGAAVAGLGETGRRLATAGTKGAASAAQQMMLRGGAALPQVASPTTQAAMMAAALEAQRRGAP